ncbi:MAG: ATP-dependent protease ATPase subunit HslU [Candidatus Cloacimonadota bacterium]|nr:ATP-dependent protease ATPase subunit HslU [Candidatus Cloacimonadota bacterium]
MEQIKDLTPRKIVEELDKYIIGQKNAKRMVAIALRNRWRRQNVDGELQNEIIPNNIILIGPTGVGKTEIARRLSKLANAPFVKVEASKFTEIGYVGRDVESMIRELVNVSINEVREEMLQKVQEQAYKNSIEIVLDKLIKPPKINKKDEDSEKKLTHYYRSREKMRKMLENGKLNEREIDVPTDSNNSPKHVEVFSNIGMESIDFNIGEMISGMLPNTKNKDKSKKEKIPKAINSLTELESQRLLDEDKILEIAKWRVENNGIVFIDEIDKIANDKSKNGGEVSRSGVQRDLLPIVEGSNVPTKHGIIDTSHILFIAAGAFHTSKPSDLIPELQGRFPIRVELHSLTEKDFVKILQFPKNALLKQYKALFNTENVELDFNKTSINKIAYYAALANSKMEDIGARRLHTIMNSLLEEYLFEMPTDKYDKQKITSKQVMNILSRIIEDDDLSRYIL